MSAIPIEPLFDEERMRVYPRLSLLVYLLAAMGVVASSTALIDIFGKPLGYDFITFWSASLLTLQGHAVDAFDFHKIFVAQRIAVPAGQSIFLWHYPPTFQLLAAPLALLPYLVSYLVFTLGTLALYVFTCGRLLKLKEAAILLVAFPGVFICAFHGQNSFLSAALFAGAVLAIERRPALAGVLLGLLAFKPQLGLLIPVALIASRQWRLFLITGATALGFALVATLILGVDLWVAFFKNTPVVRQIMEAGFLPWGKMPSAFIFFRMLGVPATFAYAAQILTALGAAAAVAWVWYKKGPTRLAFAVLVSATLLLTPYIFDYEFAILAVPLSILASDMVDRGATRNEKIALVALYGMPAIAAPLAGATHFQIGFPLLLLALGFSVRRALSLQPEAVSSK
ncbi:glycosyltransferase family 87 protein [Parvibaculum sp.]|uniref:glycosyltransferase family 87 protein n=2 Tax=Parvibaculum TaxID=256616 RepID=UPI0032107818